MLLKDTFLIFLLNLCVFGEPTPKPDVLKQNWGYVNVRPGAYMFYWSYFTHNYAKRPLILWLQGGPGLASSGVGNFIEVGPHDITMKKRKHAWTESASVLFVDSPVGTGFSYVWNETMIPKDNAQIVQDLFVFLKEFLHFKVPESLECPLYIFGEGYGGKVAADLAILLHQDNMKKKLDVKLAGVALGDPWISPAISVEAYGRFLYSNSLIDSVGFSPIAALADSVKEAINRNQNAKATLLWQKAVELVEKLTNGVDFYNVLNAKPMEFKSIESNIVVPNGKYKKNCNSYLHFESIHQTLSEFMNTEVKKQLLLPKNVTWGQQRNWVWKSLNSDIMISAVQSVERLLNTTKLPVLVYNGQLDLIVPSIGTEMWVQTMKWAGTPNWTHAKRTPITNARNETVGFYKNYKNFSLHWILRAGHMVPLDAPETALKMMKNFVGVK